MRLLKRYILLTLCLCGGLHLSYGEEAEQTEDNEEESIWDLRRVEREINRKKFIFKGEKMVGVSASYLSFSGDNADYLLLLTGVDAEGAYASVEPFAGYFYRDNRAVGVRFGYTTINATLDAATIDLGETNDISFDVPYLDYRGKSYSYAIIHRAYAALDDRGHFGLFAEIELSGASGHNTFSYESGSEVKSVRSQSDRFGISFNPGVSVFVMNNLCASVSFEFGGISYTRIKQYDAAGEYCGSRDASQMQFKFNMLAINFGITAHLWRK